MSDMKVTQGCIYCGHGLDGQHITIIFSGRGLQRRENICTVSMQILGLEKDKQFLKSAN